MILEPDLPVLVPSPVSQPHPFQTPSPNQVLFNSGKPMGEIGTEMTRTLPPNQGALGTGKIDNDGGTWWRGGRLKDREVHCPWRGRKAIGPVL